MIREMRPAGIIYLMDKRLAAVVISQIPVHRHEAGLRIGQHDSGFLRPPSWRAPRFGKLPFSRRFKQSLVITQYGKSVIAYRLHANHRACLDTVCHGQFNFLDALGTVHLRVRQRQVFAVQLERALVIRHARAPSLRWWFRPGDSSHLL